LISFEKDKYDTSTAVTSIYINLYYSRVLRGT